MGDLLSTNKGEANYAIIGCGLRAAALATRAREAAGGRQRERFVGFSRASSSNCGVDIVTGS